MTQPEGGGGKECPSTTELPKTNDDTLLQMVAQILREQSQHTEPTWHKRARRRQFCLLNRSPPGFWSVRRRGRRSRGGGGRVEANDRVMTPMGSGPTTVGEIGPIRARCSVEESTLKAGDAGNTTRSNQHARVGATGLG